MRLQILTVHVPRDLKRWLQNAAEEIDISLAAYVRRALKLHREQEEKSHEQREPDPATEPTAGDPGAVQAE